MDATLGVITHNCALIINIPYKNTLQGVQLIAESAYTN
jgi:hypothetical protein